MKNIVCFGDSNTYGFKLSNFKRYQASERWTGILKERLKLEYCIKEEGLNGRTIAIEDPFQDGLCGIQDIEACLMKHKPVSLLIVMLGTNDTKELYQASVSRIKESLREFLLKVKKLDCWDKEANILVVAPKAINQEYQTKCFGESMGRGCDIKSAQLPKEFKEVAKELGCHYLNANDYVSQLEELDGIHLTVEGHQQLAKAMEEKVREIFK